MIARILLRRISDEDNERLPSIEGQLTSASLSLPNTEVQDREVVVRSRGEEAGKKEVVCRPEKVRLFSAHFEASICHAEASPKMPEDPLIIPETSSQQDNQSDASHHQTEPRTNRSTAEIQDIEKQLRDKEGHLQIREAEVQDAEKVLRVKERDLETREADVQDVEKVLRVKERDLQICEAEVQKMLQAVNETREAMDRQEDNLRQRSAAMKEWEENLRLREATIARQPSGAARESDLFSLSSFSTIQNSPRIRSNVDLSPESNAGLKQDSRYHDNEFVSLASTTRSGPSKHTSIPSSKSHARLKEDSEYYGNE